VQGWVAEINAEQDGRVCMSTVRSKRLHKCHRSPAQTRLTSQRSTSWPKTVSMSWPKTVSMSWPKTVSMSWPKTVSMR